MRIRGKFAILAGAAAALLLAQGVAQAAPDIAKCEDAIAKGSRNVGNQEQKKNRKCIKDFPAIIPPGDADTCVANESAKALIKRGKLVDLYLPGGKCDGITGFNNTDPNDIADDTEEAAGDIMRGAFGDPVDGIVAGSKCHDKIAKRAGKKFDTELKAFRACVKNATPLTLAEVDGCVAIGVNDPKAQLTVQGKLHDDMLGQCSFASPPAGLEDGDCSTCVNDVDCAVCIGNIVDCQACLAMNNSNLGTADCDLLDDGNTSNDSCGPPAACPLGEGIYTNTQTAGGLLTVDGITPFPFPTGGVIVQHVQTASLPNCVHTTVVPDPGGFSAPLFCIPSLNFSVQVAQDGCGVGRIDSNGGSDFTIEEIGDTSAPTVVGSCGMPASNCNTPPGDSNVRVDVEVGADSLADTCGAGTEANAAVSVPVHTITWAHVPTINCVMSGPDTTGPGGMGDTTVVEFDQTLDFTTDTTSADWSDLDPDGCCLAGNGPASVQLCAFGGGGPGGLSGMGTCIDIDGANIAGPDVTTVAAGAIGSNGSPLYDLTFLTQLPNEVTGPSGLPTAVCGSPPLINFAGSVMRCVP